MGIKAIVVEDDKDVQSIFVELLKINKINVVGTGNNGKKAFEIYRKLQPDVVFMDVKMPDYDGFYGLEKIREYDPLATVILITGSEGVEEKLNDCDANAILAKPINMDKIINAINKFCIH